MSVALSVEFITVIASGNPVGGWISLLLTTLGTVTIKRCPPLALLCIAIGPITSAALEWDPTATWSVACFAAFVLSLRGMPAVLVGVVVATSVFTAAGLYAGSVYPSANPAASIAGFAALVTTTAGSSIRANRQYWFELERRNGDAISTRQAAVDRAIAEERVGIARDLHDSVGHHIAVISMHLGSAEVHLPSGAESARADLKNARVGLQSVLRETQQILHVLRPSSTSESGSPFAQCDRIPELVATFRSAGVQIAAVFPQRWPEISPGASAAAFRITQEALTNAQRHGTGLVWLTVTVTEDTDIEIEVVNPRSGNQPSNRIGGGRGLVGMTERATSVGGTLLTGSDAEIYRVRAHLPGSGRIKL